MDWVGGPAGRRVEKQFKQSAKVGGYPRGLLSVDFFPCVTNPYFHIKTSGKRKQSKVAVYPQFRPKLEKGNNFNLGTLQTLRLRPKIRKN